MLIFHCAAEINQPRNAAQWEIARIDQEEQFASRKTSRSQEIDDYEAKHDVQAARERVPRQRPKQGRPAVRYVDLVKSAMRVGRSWLCGLVVNTQISPIKDLIQAKRQGPFLVDANTTQDLFLVSCYKHYVIKFEMAHIEFSGPWGKPICEEKKPETENLMPGSL